MLLMVNGIAWTRKNVVFNPWLFASLCAHALLIPVLLLTNGGTPTGTRLFGANGGDAIAVTWIPGNSSAGQGTVDTVIPGEQDQGLSEPSVSISADPVVEPASKFVVENDPQKVFEDSTGTSLPRVAEVAHETTRDPKLAESHEESAPNQASAAKLRDASVATDSVASDSDEVLSRRKGTGGNDGEVGEGSSGGGESSGTAGSSVEFFGIRSRGKRVVYLIDASESMRQHRAIDLARDELWRSLSELKSTSQFQIVFFDLKCHTFPVAGNKTRLVTATSQHLRLAKQFMAGIRPDSGTDRLLAITQALGFDPEILFLLTDVDAPELNAQDLAAIRRSNKRQAAIHSVEFGIGPDLSRDSFLKKLARQNRGTHRYIDLKNPHP